MRLAPLTLLGSGPHASAAVLWRMQGTLHVTVIVKATLALVHEGPAHLIAPQPVMTGERPSGGVTGRSLEAASDLAPHKGRMDVTFVGHAYPAGGQPVAAAAVRLAVYRDKALLDKTLRVYGDRSGERPTPQLFRAMPITYERAYGGPTFPANPVGMGVEARVRGAAGAAEVPDASAPLPNLVDPTDPTKPAGFGPISEQWPARRQILGSLDPAALEAAIVTVPSPQIFAHFQTAPRDQQIDYLQGDEWIVLDNLHPTLPRLSSRLPGIKGACRLYVPGASGYGAARSIAMRFDTLVIDGDEQVCSIVFRGNFPVLEGEKALDGLRLACGLEIPGQALTWPDPAELTAAATPTPHLRPAAAQTPTAALTPAAPTAPVAPTARTAPAAVTPSTRPAAPPAKKAFEGTAALTDEQQAWLAQQRAAPFAGEKAGAATPEKARAPERVLTGTAALSEDDLAQLAALKAVPFGDAPPRVPAPVAPRVPVAVAPPAPAAPPRAPVPVPPSVTAPMPALVPVPAPPSVAAPAAAPPAREKSFERTTALTEREQKELRQERDAESALPFARSETAPDIAISSGPVAAPRTGPLTGTAGLTEADLATLLRVDPLPFVLPSAAAKVASGPRTRVERKVPVRIAASIPVAADVPLAVATLSWQVRPPKDSITVVVKGTFDLVEGAPARFRAEPEPLSGDVHADDDPEKSLMYPSDLTIFKPRCDVTVVGHAHAPRGGAAQMQVGFRLGEGAKKLERSLNVLGDRTWKKALGVTLAPTDPVPFDRIPLVYGRAFGGPEHAPNPVGLGHKSTEAADGTVRLANLEDPNKPVRSAGDAPAPQCFAPVAPGWPQRATNLGTYDKKWLSTRWPYFPADLDWQAAQHAPQSQQIDEIAADAAYEMRGMAPSGATLRGQLPGIKPRCFIERSGSGDEGGGFHELPLKLDTAHFDLDENKLVLVWRALLEVTDEDAPEVAVLFVTAEPAAGPALSVERAREKMLDAVVKAGDPAESPEAENQPANDVASPAATSPIRNTETARIEADLARQRRAREARLSGAGIPDDGPAPPRPPLPAEPAAPAPDPTSRARVIAALDAGEALDDVDLSDADLSDLDFEGRSLLGAVLLRSNLRRCNFDGANLSGAQLGGADLTDARLAGATLDGADFQNGQLERANLEGASLHGTSFAKAEGRGAIFRRARGAQTLFAGGTWTDAVFDEADLPAADFSAATLDEASFVRARLAQVRLLDARGTKARFDGSQMPGARAGNAVLTESSLRSVEAPGSVWDKATLEGTSFTGAVLAGAGFSGVKAEGADFGGVDATEGRFRKADLRGARFVSANLMQATFERADLQGADLRGANLHEAETWKAKLKGAQLDLAIVTRSKLGGKKG